jgi:ketosteroid isomerase-like protein
VFARYCAGDVAGERQARAGGLRGVPGRGPGKTARLVDPEVEFHGTVGGLQEGQIAHGQSQIDQTFEAEDLEAWEERRLEAEEYIDAGDDVVVLLHEYRRGRGSGVELEAKTAVVVAVSGGRVVRIQGYMDRATALEAAGLSE